MLLVVVVVVVVVVGLPKLYKNIIVFVSSPVESVMLCVLMMYK